MKRAILNVQGCILYGYYFYFEFDYFDYLSTTRKGTHFLNL